HPTALYAPSLHDALPIFQSPHAVVPTSFVGMHAPATCVATGRAVLAFQSDDEIDRLLSAGIPAYTTATITDAGEFRRLLSDIRSDRKSTRLNSSHVKISY